MSGGWANHAGQQQSFVWLGFDSLTERFVESAMSAGWKCLGHWMLPSAVAQRLMVTQFASLDVLASLEDQTVVVLGGPIDQKESVLAALTKLPPNPLIVSTPLTQTPDPLYEFGLFRTENNLPILVLDPESLHPAIARMKTLASDTSTTATASANGSTKATHSKQEAGAIRWMEASLPINPQSTVANRYGLGWSTIAQLAGPIRLVLASGPEESEEPVEKGKRKQVLKPETPGVMVSARTAGDTLVTVRWDQQPHQTSRLRFETKSGVEVTSVLPGSFSDSITLSLVEQEQRRQETIDPINADDLLAHWRAILLDPSLSNWDHAVAQADVVQAIARSLKYRKQIDLDRQHFSDESAFKSIMATTGCGLVWILLLVAILAAAGVPYIQYLVLPVLVGFMLLQLLLIGLRQQQARKANAGPRP